MRSLYKKGGVYVNKKTGESPVVITQSNACASVILENGRAVALGPTLKVPNSILKVLTKSTKRSKDSMNGSAFKTATHSYLRQQRRQNLRAVAGEMDRVSEHGEAGLRGCHAETQRQRHSLFENRVVVG